MFYTGGSLIGLVALALRLLSYLILLDVILSWAWYARIKLASPYQPWVRTLRRVTDPVLDPIRRMLRPWTPPGLDMSPLVAILLLQFAGEFLLSIAR